MDAVIIRRSQDGNLFEVWENPYGVAYKKIRGFRTYEKARAFAEKEALDKNLELQDNIKVFEDATPVDGRLTSEECLFRAIFGKHEKED